MSSLTELQAATIRTALERTTEGSRRALDPADTDDAKLIVLFLELTGKTPTTHPGLYADLDRLATAGPRQVDAADAAEVLDIVDSGRDVHGRATARVWHHGGGRFVSGAAVLALDADAIDRVVAFGHVNRVGGGLAPAATRSAVAEAAPASMTTVGFSFSQAMPDADPTFGVVSHTAPVPEAPEGLDATVTDPVTKINNSTVKIGLARPQIGELDYYYTKDPGSKPEMVVPFTGSAKTQRALRNVGSNGQFTSGLMVTTNLYWVTGTQYVQHVSTQTLTSQVTGVADTGVVSWAYPYDPDGEPGQHTSLMYEPCSYAGDPNEIAFFCQFQVPVVGPNDPSYTFQVCSTDWPDQPSVDCYQILPLSLYWHCIAEGTLVELADGSTTPIESVDNTQRVRRDSGGGSLGVEATTRGRHDGEALRLVTSDDRSLLVTPGHPISTPNGLVSAADLAVGDQVNTVVGVTTLVSCDRVAGDDTVFVNLKLVDADDRARGLTETAGTFVANGIVVGDFDSMNRQHYRTVHSIDYMLPRIPERYHTDYASTLADISRDNATYGAQF